MGLLIAVMLVAAALIAMVIFVVSQEFNTPTPPTKPPVVDTTPPKIQSILASSITQTGAVITWVTDEPATSQVQICEGDVLCLPWTTLGDNYVRKHSVTVNDLKDNTAYHVTVKSIDEKGNETISDMSKTFTTGSGTQTDTTPPTISEIDAISISASGATITWTTNEEATSQVEYGTSTTYGEATQLDEELTASHSVSLSGLDSDTTYHFKIKSKDASDNEGVTSTDHTFKTLTSVAVGPQLGKRAPGFTLENPAGESVTLSDYQGKIVMLNFWATWCTPCIAEMPHFQEIQENWSGDKDLVILAVNLREGATMVESWMNNKGYTFPVLLDPVGQVASLYNAATIPRTFFIDDEGIIKEIKIGRFTSQSDIEIILDSL